MQCRLSHLGWRPGSETFPHHWVSEPTLQPKPKGLHSFQPCSMSTSQLTWAPKLTAAGFYLQCRHILRLQSCKHFSVVFTEGKSVYLISYLRIILGKTRYHVVFKVSQVKLKPKRASSCTSEMNGRAPLTLMVQDHTLRDSPFAHTSKLMGLLTCITLRMYIITCRSGWLKGQRKNVISLSFQDLILYPQREGVHPPQQLIPTRDFPQVYRFLLTCNIYHIL